jgi:hypothetical protein
MHSNSFLLTLVQLRRARRRNRHSCFALAIAINVNSSAHALIVTGGNSSNHHRCT